MGVIYKLKPEIKDFILEQKRANPILSCRGLSLLVENKFQIKVSKSSINSIIKDTGLSMPVGRRLKKRRRKREIPKPVALLEMKTEESVEPVVEQPAEPVLEEPTKMPVEAQVDITIEIPLETQCTGAILLKAADYLIGGSCGITEAIKKRFNQPENDLLAKTEALIYMPLYELSSQQPKAEELPRLWSLINKKPSLESILSYLAELQRVRTIVLDLSRIISNLLQEVRCIKVNLSDGRILYLDGQLHTVWSTPHIPYDFATTVYNIKSYINKYFQEDRPFVFFMTPGYDIPTEEFFNFILSLDSKGKKITKLTLYGNKFEELEVFNLEQAKRRCFVFGLWPWQFVEFRKVNSLKEFKPFYLEALKKDFFAAEIEIELSQPTEKQVVTLKGYALKINPAEKTRLVILSNLFAETAKPQELLNIYLSHWPNLEEAFQDFSRKVELFTYTASSHRFFAVENPNLNRDASMDIKALFYHYLKALDLYVRWHFLPSGFEDKDFSTIKRQFYDLKAVLEKQKDHTLVTFQPPPEFRFLKELEYICRRLNEREIVFADGKRLWFLT